MSKPVTEKVSEHGTNGVISYAASAMQGWRTGMEDAHITQLDLEPGTHLFAVFDGHGGKCVAQYCAAHFADVLTANASFKAGDVGKALTETFLRMDELLHTEEARTELAGLENDKDDAPTTRGDVSPGNCTLKDARRLTLAPVHCTSRRLLKWHASSSR
jgi:serine/threonine protein phosphatase PrpC